MIYTHFRTPIGQLLLTGIPSPAGCSLAGVYLPKQQVHPAEDWQHAPDLFACITLQLEEYFSGKRKKFAFPLQLSGSVFQQRVLKIVSDIPYGKTVAYGEIANLISQPQASRAVGLANATNRLPIVIPCHRVIGKNGQLTGYAGGLEVKRWLLELEQAVY